MASVGDVFQVTVTTEFLGQQCLNVYHYVVSQLGDPEDLPQYQLEAFVDGVVSSQVRALQSDLVTYQSQYTVNLNNPEEYSLADLDSEGGIDSDLDAALPSFVAMVYRYGRRAAGTRYGYKRYAGLVESQVAGNTWAAGAPTLLVAALAASSDAGTYQGWVFTPFIASHPIVLGTNPSGYQPNGVTFRGVTTQRSRKPTV